jgi:DNA-binding CsgD family transcriptional regulator
MTWLLALEPLLPRVPGAACRDHPEPLWDERAYPGEPARDAHQRHDRALLICGTCPAIAACDAARRPHDGGVWAGKVHRGPDRPAENKRRAEEQHRRERVEALTRTGHTAKQIGQLLGVHPDVVSRIRTRLQAERAS